MTYPNSNGTPEKSTKTRMAMKSNALDKDIYAVLCWHPQLSSSLGGSCNWTKTLIFSSLARII